MAKRTGGGGDFGKMMEQFQFRIPGVDWQGLMALQQRNLEAVAKANQVLFEGAGVVVRREFETLQAAMDEAMAAARELMQEGDPQANAAKRLELARAAFERSLDNMRELSELAAKCNREALDVVNKRTLEAFDEMRTALEQKG